MKGESSVPHDSDSAINNDNGTGSCLETNTQHANSSSEKNQVFSSCTFSFADSTVVSNVADESFHAKTEKRRSNLQAQQHIMAEKKRREKLSTMFLELSTMVPGLKKVTFCSFKLYYFYFFSTRKNIWLDYLNSYNLSDIYKTKDECHLMSLPLSLLWKTYWDKHLVFQLKKQNYDRGVDMKI